MNLRHLRFFVSAVDLGGAKNASQRLNVTQPAVSAGIRTLEEELGQKLFIRTAGGQRMRPTAQGMELYEHAVEILRRCDLAKSALSRDRQRRPTLGLGVLQTLGASLVSAVFDTVQKTAPEWHWRLREGGVQQLETWMRQKRIQLAVSVVTGDCSDETILWTEPYVLFVAKRHPLAEAGGVPVKAAELEAERVILRGGCELPRGSLPSAGLRIRSALRVQRDELAMRLVERGVGVVVAPASLRTEGVVPVRIQGFDATRSIGIRCRSDAPHAAVDSVVQAFRAARTEATTDGPKSVMTGAV